MDRYRSGKAAAATLVVLVFVVASAGTAAAPATVGSTQVDPDSVLLRVDLAGDGSAAWTVEYRVRLDDENATEAFESLQADIEANGSAFEERFGDRMRRTVADAENATGREMAVRNVSVRAGRQEIGQGYGVVVYTFEWTGFAVADGGTLRAGDALAGLFLDGETSLVIGWPDGYRLADVSPEPGERRDRAVVWHGRIDFAEGEPLLVVTTAPPATTATTSPTTAAGGGGSGGGDRGGVSPAWLAAGAAALLALSGVGVWLYRRRDGGPPADGDGPSEELLSNEERVLRLLRERGGRMKQQDVAAALDWTDARTSQVVGELREAGEVEAFRLGRENVLSLPDDDRDI